MKADHDEKVRAMKAAHDAEIAALKASMGQASSEEIEKLRAMHAEQIK